MRVFNRSVKRLQRDSAATVRLNDGRDFTYLREEVAARLVDRLDYINRKFDKAIDILQSDAGTRYERRAVAALQNLLENKGGRDRWSDYAKRPEMED